MDNDIEKLYLKMIDTILSMSDEELKALVECCLKLEPPKGE